MDLVQKIGQMIQTSVLVIQLSDYELKGTVEKKHKKKNSRINWGVWCLGTWPWKCQVGVQCGCINSAVYAATPSVDWQKNCGQRKWNHISYHNY